jgi:hypothetical protein
MRSWILFSLLIFGPGCHGFGHRVPADQQASPADQQASCGSTCGPQLDVEGGVPASSGDEAGVAPPCGGCQPPQEVHVKIPRQKVVLKVPTPSPPTAPPTAPSPVQEVLLVPRTVYVPYAPQVPVAPARMLPLQVAPVAPVPLVPVAPAVTQQPAPCQTSTPSCRTLGEAAQALEALQKQKQDLEIQVKQIMQQVEELKNLPPGQ